MEIGDFNGDGLLDVASLVAAADGDGLDILLQTPAGTLAPPVTYHVPHATGLDAGNLNGDYDNNQHAENENLVYRISGTGSRRGPRS